jgi:hypothetical protein
MTEFDRNLPQPSLPEHELLRQAAPSPVLSDGFRDSVMSQCHTSIRQAQRSFRIKVAASTVAACALLALAWTGMSSSTSTVPEVADEPPTETPYYDSQYPDYPNPRIGTPDPSRGSLAIDKSKPLPDSENKQMEQLMEQLRDRSQNMLDPSLLR